MYNFYEEERSMIGRMTLEVIKRYIVSIKKELIKLEKEFNENSTVDNFLRMQQMLDLYLFAKDRIKKLEAK